MICDATFGETPAWSSQVAAVWRQPDPLGGIVVDQFPLLRPAIEGADGVDDGADTGAGQSSFGQVIDKGLHFASADLSQRPPQHLRRQVVERRLQVPDRPFPIPPSPFVERYALAGRLNELIAGFPEIHPRSARRRGALA
jgi:hypothetical protein